MTAKRLEIFVIIVIIAVIGIVYAFKQNPVLAPTTAVNDTPSSALSLNPNSSEVQGSGDTQAKQQVPTNVVTYQGVAGKNAFELLKSDHTVEAKHYSFGDLVTSIDGVAPDANHFWAMYVNGEFSQVGASAYETKSTDTIKWQIDAVVNTK